jgi:hypothetical protein
MPAPSCRPSLPRRTIAAALALLALAPGAACAGGSGGADPAPEPPRTEGATPTTPAGTVPPAGPSVRPGSGPGAGVRAVDWANGSYPGDSCGDKGIQGTGDRPDVPAPPFAAHDGDAPSANGVDHLTVAPEVAYGDVTGDGRDEAVVNLLCDEGGSFRWSVVWLYGDDPAVPGTVRRLAPVAPLADQKTADGRRVEAQFLDRATIADGRVTTTWVTYDGTEKGGRPLVQATARQRWQAGALVLDGAPSVTVRSPG